MSALGDYFVECNRIIRSRMTEQELAEEREFSQHFSEHYRLATPEDRRQIEHRNNLKENPMTDHSYQEVMKRIGDVVSKYGEAPNVSENLIKVFVKIMHALEHMDKKLDEKKTQGLVP